MSTHPSRIFIAPLLMAFVAAANAQELGSSLNELLGVARQQNPALVSMQLESAAATERVEPAGALPDPKLRAELRDITRMGEQNPTLSPSGVGSTRYLLMQDLPWAGKRDLKRQAAQSLAEAASGRAANAWRELVAKIKTTYAQLYYLDQTERLTQEILDLMVRLEKVAQVRYAGGMAAQQDVIRAQLEQTGMRNELIALQAERRRLQSRMNALLGRPPQEPLGTPAQIRPLPAPASVSFAALEPHVRAGNALLRAEGAMVQAAEKGRDLTYRNRYPDFTVGVSPIQYGRSVREWEVMVELNIPLQQASRRAQEREAEAVLASARSRREDVVNQVLADLYENIAGLEAARQVLELTTNSLLPQSQLTFQSALVGYESGKVDFATLLDAQKQIRQGRLSQAKAGVDAQMRLAEIERIVGEEQ